MKKLLLASLLCAGAFVSVSAQDLYFLFDGQEVKNGATVEYFEYTVEEGPYETIAYNEPPLYLVSNKLSPVNVKVVGSPANFQFCFGDGFCEYGPEVTKTNIALSPGVPEDLFLEFMISFAPGEEVVVPEYEILVEAYYVNDPSNVITMTVKMGKSAGVEELGGSLNNVVCDGHSLIYDVAQASQLSLYSLSGKMLLNKTVAGSGSLDLGKLSKGIYLYRLAGKNGKAVKSAKIVVK